MIKSKNKIIICSIILTLTIISIIAVIITQSKIENKLKVDTEYILVFSDMDTMSKIKYFNGNGELLLSKRINAKDLSIPNNSETFMVGGERFGTHLFLETSKLSFKPLKFNGTKSGITAITSTKDNFIGVVNNGFTEDSYKTTLVVQSKDKGDTYSGNLDVYARHIFVDNDVLYIVGSSMLKNIGWTSTVRTIDLTDCKEIATNNGSNDKKSMIDEYVYGYISRDSLYCVAKRTSDMYLSEVHKMNASSLIVEDRYELPKETYGVTSKNNTLYGIVKNTVVIFDENYNIKETLFETDAESWLEHINIVDNCIVTVTRKKPEFIGKNKYVGDVYFYDLTKQALKKYPINFTDDDPSWHVSAYPITSKMF